MLSDFMISKECFVLQEEVDHYDMLGIDPAATVDEIRKVTSQESIVRQKIA